MRLIDLSHTMEHGTIAYRGLPAPAICDFLSREASRAIYATDTEFQIGRIDMVANTGTYIDSPFHRSAQLPLESPAHLDAVVATASAGRAMAREALRGLDARGNADWARPGCRIQLGTLLGAEIPICEHMCNSGNLPGGRFRFPAVPVKAIGFGTFPASAYAMVEDGCSGE